MANTYSGLARDVLSNEFDSNTGITTFSQISGWFSSHLGDLNVLLNTNFSGADPDLQDEERAIFKDMYRVSFYEKSMRNVLRGVVSATDGGNIQSVSDGDNQIVFINRNEVSKTYRGLMNDAKADLKEKVTKYNIYAAQPLQVAGVDGLFSGVYQVS